MSRQAMIDHALMFIVLDQPAWSWQVSEAHPAGEIQIEPAQRLFESWIEISARAGQQCHRVVPEPHAEGRLRATAAERAVVQRTGAQPDVVDDYLAVNQELLTHMVCTFKNCLKRGV